ncbi:MAG: hypothetical protein JSV64_06705, partial [Candidatus Bathyarchaeota archaeon]
RTCFYPLMGTFARRKVLIFSGGLNVDVTAVEEKLWNHAISSHSSKERIVKMLHPMPVFQFVGEYPFGCG